MSDQLKLSQRKSTWVLVFLLFLVVGGGALLVAYRIRSRASVDYTKGRLYLENGDYEAAMACFEKVLAERPDQYEAQTGIARCLASTRDYDNAHAAVNKAVEKGLDPTEGTLLRARFMLDEAVYRLDSAGKTISPETCDELVVTYLDPAINMVEQHLKLATAPARTYEGLGDLYSRKSDVLSAKWGLLREAHDAARQRADFEAAKRLRDEWIGVLPNLRKVQADAIDAYTKAIDSDGSVIAPRLAIARCTLSSYVPEPARARQVLLPIIKFDRDNAEARRLLALADSMEGNYPSALDHIGAAAPANKEMADRALQVLEAEVLIKAEQWEKADAATEALLAAHPRHDYAAFLRGRVLVHEGRCEEAVGVLQNVVARVSKPWAQARYDLAEALRHTGRREQAVAMYMRAIEDGKDALAGTVEQGRRLREVQYRSAMALSEMLEAENPRRAAEYASHALQLYPHWRPAYDAVCKYLRVLEAHPAEFEKAALVHAYGLLMTHKDARALAVCREALKNLDSPGEGNGLRLFSARLLRRQGLYAEAEKEYEAVRRNRGRMGLQPAYELAALHMRLGHYEKAGQIYQERRAENPGDPRAAAGLVAVRMATGDTEGAAELLKQTGREKTADINAPLLQIYMREGKADEAVAMLKQMVEAEPNSVSAHALLGEMLWRTGAPTQAREAFNRAHELEPDNLAAYRRGFLDLGEDRYADAADLFREAFKRFGGAIPESNLALALYAMGKTDEAQRHLTHAVEGPAGKTAVGNLLWWYKAVAFAGVGQLDEALAANGKVGQSRTIGPAADREALLRRLAAIPPEARRRTARDLNLTLALAQSDCLTATQARVEALKQHLPDEPLPLCWLASVHTRRRRHADAENVLKSVVSRYPTFGFARVEISRTFALQDKLDLAVAALSEAMPHLDEEDVPAAQYMLGGFYESVGRYDEAIESYRMAMVHKAYAPLAGNNLACLLASHRNDPQAALPVAREAFENANALPQVVDTYGWVHYLCGNHKEALRLLRRAKVAMPAHPTVRFHLGMAYLKAGHPEDARIELKEALSLSDAFPEADEAARVLADLKTDAPARNIAAPAQKL